ncbi:MAG TPA: hypothetical protein VEI25_16460 [Paraburkholderia sp.]|nr:hypothetical protein [Paraburkholderia sp.]
MDLSLGDGRPRYYDVGEASTTGTSIMPERACFTPRVIEPVTEHTPEGLGLALELWFAHPVDGIDGRALRIHLRSDARMPQAETLRDLLHALGTDIVVT